MGAQELIARAAALADSGVVECLQALTADGPAEVTSYGLHRLREALVRLFAEALGSPTPPTGPPLPPAFETGMPVGARDIRATCGMPPGDPFLGGAPGYWGPRQASILWNALEDIAQDGRTPAGQIARRALNRAKELS